MGAMSNDSWTSSSSPQGENGHFTNGILNGCAISLDNTAESKEPVQLNGERLDIATLVAVARFGKPACIDSSRSLAEKIESSVQFLDQELSCGKSIYGITTGFGGSADKSTTQLKALQIALLQMQLCGVLPDEVHENGENLAYDANIAPLSMPESWVRAAMLVRINALLRGHSAIRMSILQSLTRLLQCNIIPLVPLHGSISASGDLSPLSYAAGALSGNPDVLVWTGSKRTRRLMPSDQALRASGIEPVSFGPKEGLALLNGTAFSVAVAGLAMHEANDLARLVQVLTAMGVEALAGSTESFEPFIAADRPHPGQTQVADGIFRALDGSKLVQESRSHDTRSLRQDRYALRTASQWLGPGLEDLRLATEQLATELNSTTDNPLVDASSRRTYHGGNFQAVSVTSSTEKTRLALQMMGKLLFAQSSELLDVKMNNGLPPNLALDNPSTSYTLKGVDINMAAYMAELGFLANPVSSHVQSAEMGNQSLNSMALVSTRYTHKAVDIVSMMASAHLYSLCQALDLRAVHEIYLSDFRPIFDVTCANHISKLVSVERTREWQDRLWLSFTKNLELTVGEDSDTRFATTTRALQPILLDVLASSTAHDEKDLWQRSDEAPIRSFAQLVKDSTDDLAAAAHDVFIGSRDAYCRKPDATPFLGAAAKHLYRFVRVDLGVPLHRGLVDYPCSDEAEHRADAGVGARRNTGSWISKIYAAMRDGRVAEAVSRCT